MLALVGKNPMGNVLHVITGPESEFFIDVHGAKILDITELLNLMDQEERVFLSITRCKSENATEGALKMSKAPYLSSFGAGKCDNPDCPDCNPKTGEKQSKAKAPKKSTKKGRCNYCHTDKVLLPLPGFSICTSCAQIELGLKQILKDDEEPPKKGRKNAGS